MNPQPLSFLVLLGFLQSAIAQLKDPRQPSNATYYSLKDAFLGAFSVFFMRCESFLEHQRQMHSRHCQYVVKLSASFRRGTVKQKRPILPC